MPETTPTAAQAEAEIKAALEAGPTPGPWQIVVDDVPCYLGAPHKETRIFTTWEHPQLKGPMPVVNHSIGVGASQGCKPVHLVHIEPEDAAYIAAANPANLRALLDEVQALRAAFDAACRFIDVHAGDPDMTVEMVSAYAEFQRQRELVAAISTQPAKEGA